jgi:hypothetical protein
MIYNEEYITTASTVKELITILETKVPSDATVDVCSSDYCASTEVWYDKGTNSVIFK